jgi:hypothetical protein
VILTVASVHILESMAGGQYLCKRSGPQYRLANACYNVPDVNKSYGQATK